MDQKTFVYACSWSPMNGPMGLYEYRFDSESGELTFIRQPDGKTNFGTTLTDEKKGLFYVLEEGANLPGVHGGGGGGRLFVYRPDRETGELQEVQCVPTYCSNPSYMTLDATGNYMVVAHHTSRSCVTKMTRDAYGNFVCYTEHDDPYVELFSVNEDGTIGQLLDAVKHEGCGPDSAQQSHPHPHCAVMSPSGKLFTVCDKGNDSIYMYTIDYERQRLAALQSPRPCPPGSKPRYCAYHPTLPYLYQNNEGLPHVTAYRYEEDGRLEEIGRFNVANEETSVLPGDFGQQDLRMDAAGQYLYTVVRDPAMIAVYRVEQDTGALTLIQNFKVDAQWPRGCTLSPDGRFLLVAGMRSGNILTYAVGEDGLLHDTGLSVKQPGAAAVTFFTADN